MTEQYYVLSWYEWITVAVPCRWRELLRLPLQRVSEWQRFSVAIRSDALPNYMFNARRVKDIQVEYSNYPTPYITNRPINPAFENTGCDWPGVT